MLLVTGEVERPVTFTLDDLRNLDPQRQIADVSAVDAARKGRGVWLAAILDAVQPRPAVRYLTLHASADDFHASIPLEDVRERGYFIYELDGQPLPQKNGGPLRFAILDFAACHSAEIDECANVKFVDCLELSATSGRDNRPHDAEEHAELHKKAEP